MLEILSDIFDETRMVPPDFDDSGVNIAIGTLLQKSSQFPMHFRQWSNSNNQLQILMNAVKVYAYRPLETSLDFSLGENWKLKLKLKFQDSDSNLIDPRSYFYARPFLEAAKTSGQPVALITTWVSGNRNGSENKINERKEKGFLLISKMLKIFV